MWKISITTDRNETMTIFVAADAFNSIQPAMDDNDKILILQNYATRMIKRMREQAPNSPLPTSPIYLEKFEFVDANATITQYLQPTDSTVIRQIATSPSLHPKQLSLAQTTGIEKWNMKWRAEDDAEVLAIKHTVAFAQSLPPIDLEDSIPTLQPVDGTQHHEVREQIILDILMSSDHYAREPQTSQEIAHNVATFSADTLERVRDFYLQEDEETNLLHDTFNERIEALDKKIANETRLVINSPAYQFLEKTTNEHICATFFYQATLENIAVALHNAARDFYKSEWQKYRGNINALREMRESFNLFFADLAHIEEDFSLRPASWTYQQLLDKKLDQTLLQQLISDLLNASYKNEAFTHLADRLNDLRYFDNIVKQKTNHKLTLTNTDACNAFEAYRKSCEAIQLPISAVINVHNDIKVSIKEIDKDAKALSDDMHPIVVSRQSFWQRNKGTIISLCVGAAIAVGAALAIAFAPITLPTIFIAGIIAGTVAAIIGVSAIIGRKIDKRRATKKLDYSDGKENKRLLDDFDRTFAHDNQAQGPDNKKGKPVAFDPRKSALVSNSMHRNNNAVVPTTRPELVQRSGPNPF